MQQQSDFAEAVKGYSVRSLGDDSVLGVDRDIQCFTH